ncbi:MAG TPA: transglutaminase domain-containing protein [Chitinophagaceae bacterium]|nr:transglutaminase domain-containing protein [Chitinophagaceae bacterium]
MPIGKLHNNKKLFAQLLLLAVPTIALAGYVVWDANRFFNILENNWLQQTIYFAIGIAASFIFYSWRFRFLTTTAILFALLYIFYKAAGSITVGEFDAFFFSVKFLVFAVLLAAGWLTGYGFSRARWYTIFWSALLLCVQIIIVSKITDIKASTLISAFAPVLAYSFYIIYTAELIRNMSDDEKSFGWYVAKRMLGFGLLVLVLLLSLLTIFNNEFKAIEKEWGNTKPDYEKNEGNKESLTQNNRDGSVSNKSQVQLAASLGKGKRLVFVAKLDNFFNDNVTPNPLYFTAYYYTKFDTLTQTFEIDSLMPMNDLFKPNPSKIPLYFAKTDSTVIKNTNATKERKVVSAEVYKVLLSPDEYVAPSTSFFCQPIPVAPEYKQQYTSAYRAKMWVSNLNSAYFIYNPAGNQSLEQFQEQRFNVLRTVTDFSTVDKKFFKYYTFMPANHDYDSLRILAQKITANAKTPIDKMIAIRDYFLSKDEFDEPLYKYSDNPGIPGLPSASKLNYFLFENRKGYCAYFAGATLFMLRALGIPSRVAAGFLTIDRSTKNPGWYWFYEDQAHAWVQVYFPEYGWIDFDTTVPDVNAQQAPQPDETPPLNMQDAYFVADGIITSVDTVQKKLSLSVNRILFHDKDFETDIAQTIQLDGSLAAVTRDTGNVSFSTLTKGMHITATSFAEALKNILPADDDSFPSVIKKIAQPVPVDEIKIIDEESKKQQQKKEAEKGGQPIDWLKVLWIALIVIASLTLLVFSLPVIIWQYYNTKARSASGTKSRAFAAYRAAMYYLNQTGYNRTNKGPQEYAAFIDNQFGTSFLSFSNVYQKIKYSSQPLTASEEMLTQSFYKPFISSIRKQIPLKIKTSRFLNVYRTLSWFTQNKNV